MDGMSNKNLEKKLTKWKGDDGMNFIKSVYLKGFNLV